MTDFEKEQPEKELSQEQLQNLLTETILWVEKIITDNPNPLYPSVGSNSIMDAATDTQATITVGDLIGEYAIEYRERNFLDATKNIVIEYSIKESRDGKLLLTTTGEQPDVIDALLEEDTNQDEFARAVQAIPALQEEAERPATQNEIKQFHTILELAAFGDEKFDFEAFERQYKDYIDDLKDIQTDADTLEENNPE